MTDHNTLLNEMPTQGMPPAQARLHPSTNSLQTLGANNFDFCRFWLAVLVIFSHSFALADGNEHREPLGLLTSGQLGSGRFAVCCFFAISGFLISHSWVRSATATSFLWKRVKRIYPGFIVAVLLGAFVIAPLTSGSTLSMKQIFLLPVNLLALRDTQPTPIFENNPFPGALNGSLWTIPYEFKSYLVLMVLGSFGLLAKRSWYLTSLLVAIIAASVVYPGYRLGILERGPIAAVFGQATAWFDVIPYFITGMAFYQFRSSILLNNRYAICCALALLCSAAFPPAGRIVFPVAITYLLFWFAFHPAVKLHRWARYGDFSYGIYLYAFPIQQLLAMAMPGISPILMFVVATPLAVLSGLLSWHIVEKRFVKSRERSHQLQTSLPPELAAPVPCLAPQ